MSKVDALRALREAKYTRTTAPSAPKGPATPASRPPTRSVAAGTDDLCGHRNISGRSCTREADHLKAGTKNHRYA